MMVDIKLSCILLASGHSKRFGSDKLLFPIGGITMIERAFASIPVGVFDYVCVVTRSAEIAALARKVNITPIINDDKTDDSAKTIRLGLENLPSDAGACMFLVCDQPYLTPRSVERLALAAKAGPGRIHALSFNGERGNPVIFPRQVFGELAALPKNGSGRLLIKRHPELLTLVEADSAKELVDIDERPGTRRLTGFLL